MFTYYSYDGVPHVVTPTPDGIYEVRRDGRGDPVCGPGSLVAARRWIQRQGIPCRR